MMRIHSRVVELEDVKRRYSPHKKDGSEKGKVSTTTSSKAYDPKRAAQKPTKRSPVKVASEVKVVTPVKQRPAKVPTPRSGKFHRKRSLSVSSTSSSSSSESSRSGTPTQDERSQRGSPKSTKREVDQPKQQSPIPETQPKRQQSPDTRIVEEVATRKPTKPKAVYAGKTLNFDAVLNKPEATVSVPPKDNGGDSDVVIEDEQPAPVQFDSPVEVKVIYSNTAKFDKETMTEMEPCALFVQPTRSVSTQTDMRATEPVQEHTVKEIRHPDGRVEHVNTWRFFQMPNQRL